MSPSEDCGIRVKGDKVVQNMLDIKIDRENQWKRKASTASKADKMVKEILKKEECSQDGPKMQCHMGSVHEETKDEDMGHMKTDQMLQKIKVAIKRKLEYENHLKNLDKAKTLIKQGNLLSLAMEQNSDLDWKAIIFDVKKGLLKFALNSIVDTLLTNTNLVQWGKRMSDKCKSCGGKET